LTGSRARIADGDQEGNVTGRAEEKVEKQGAALPLTDTEIAALRLLLRTSVTDLGMEIRHTDSYDFRQELKTQRAVLEGMLRRLGEAPEAGNGGTH
jgi:hypothetical protein